MPADLIAGCLAEGCFMLVLELFFEGLFPTKGRARRDRRHGRESTPVPLWERAASVVFWAVLIGLTIFAFWGMSR